MSSVNSDEELIETLKGYLIDILETHSFCDDNTSCPTTHGVGPDETVVECRSCRQERDVKELALCDGCVLRKNILETLELDEPLEDLE